MELCAHLCFTLFFCFLFSGTWSQTHELCEFALRMFLDLCSQTQKIWITGISHDLNLTSGVSFVECCLRTATGFPVFSENETWSQSSNKTYASNICWDIFSQTLLTIARLRITTRMRTKRRKQKHWLQSWLQHGFLRWCSNIIQCLYQYPIWLIYEWLLLLKISTFLENMRTLLSQEEWVLRDQRNHTPFSLSWNH